MRIASVLRVLLCLLPVGAAPSAAQDRLPIIDVHMHTGLNRHRRRRRPCARRSTRPCLFGTSGYRSSRSGRRC